MDDLRTVQHLRGYQPIALSLDKGMTLYNSILDRSPWLLKFTITESTKLTNTVAHPFVWLAVHNPIVKVIDYTYDKFLDGVDFSAGLALEVGTGISKKLWVSLNNNPVIHNRLQDSADWVREFFESLELSNYAKVYAPIKSTIVSMLPHPATKIPEKDELEEEEERRNESSTSSDDPQLFVDITDETHTDETQARELKYRRQEASIRRYKKTIEDLKRTNEDHKKRELAHKAEMDQKNKELDELKQVLSKTQTELKHAKEKAQLVEEISKRESESEAKVENLMKQIAEQKRLIELQSNKLREQQQQQQQLQRLQNQQQTFEKGAMVVQISEEVMEDKQHIEKESMICHEQGTNDLPMPKSSIVKQAVLKNNKRAHA